MANTQEKKDLPRRKLSSGRRFPVMGEKREENMAGEIFLLFGKRKEKNKLRKEGNGGKKKEGNGEKKKEKIIVRVLDHLWGYPGL